MLDEKNAESLSNPQLSASMPSIQASEYYTYVDLDDPSLTQPQPSDSIPPVKSQAYSSTSTVSNIPVRTRRGRPFGMHRLPYAWWIFALVVAGMLLLAVGIAVYAQGPLQTSPPKRISMVRPILTISTQPPSHAEAMATQPAIMTISASTGVPQTLPARWTAAGLMTADELEAQRTGLAFVDREMSLDFRIVGTRAQHGGTFTAAVFLLTPHARARFAKNDIRVANNVLFDSVQQQQLIQEVVNEQSQLVKFAVLGRQQFAWIDVSFQLWQSRLNPQTGQRVEGLELDPATHGSRVHHLIVLLLRVPPVKQGPNAPMGGTGWLVTTYALDPGAALPAVIQPV
jgi:hypothetical protein